MTFSIKWEKEGVFVRFTGVVGSRDLIDANNYILSSPAFESINFQVFDFLSIEGFEVSSHDINIIAAIDKAEAEVKTEMKIAILSQHTKIEAIVAEYDQLMTGSNWFTKIFPDETSAYQWLGLK